MAKKLPPDPVDDHPAAEPEGLPEPAPDPNFDPTLPAPPQAAVPAGFSEFPKMLYRLTSGVVEQKIVASAEAQRTLRKTPGWQESPIFPDDDV